MAKLLKSEISGENLFFILSWNVCEVLFVALQDSIRPYTTLLELKRKFSASGNRLSGFLCQFEVAVLDLYCLSLLVDFCNLMEALLYFFNSNLEISLSDRKNESNFPWKSKTKMYSLCYKGNIQKKLSKEYKIQYLVFGPGKVKWKESFFYCFPNFEETADMQGR